MFFEVREFWLPKDVRRPEEYEDAFAADPLRYTLARNLPETRDMNFTWEGFLARNNNELGNNFGNFINRVLTFCHKYFDGRVPEWSEAAMTDLDRRFMAACIRLSRRHLGQTGTNPSVGTLIVTSGDHGPEIVGRGEAAGDVPLENLEALFDQVIKH